MPTPTLREADLSLPGLLRQLDSPRHHASVKVAHNTWARYGVVGGSAAAVEVVLHRTVIATFSRITGLYDGSGRPTPDLWVLTIGTGGWDTVTTRDRLNRVLRPLGITLYPKAGVSFLAGISVDGHQGIRFLSEHDYHRLPVATVLTDGTRVVPPSWDEGDTELFARITGGRTGFASLTAARPEPAGGAAI